MSSARVSTNYFVLSNWFVCQNFGLFERFFFHLIKNSENIFCTSTNWSKDAVLERCGKKIAYLVFDSTNSFESTNIALHWRSKY